MRRADKLITFMCWLLWNLGASNTWNPQDLSRPVMGLLYLVLTERSLPIMCESQKQGYLICPNLCTVERNDTTFLWNVAWHQPIDTVTSQTQESPTDRCANRKACTALNRPNKLCFSHPDNYYPPILSFSCSPLLPLGRYRATNQNYLLPESRCQISNYSWQN